MFATNPWTTDADTAHGNAIATLVKYASLATKKAQTLPELKKELNGFAQDLDTIQQIFRKDPDVWRQHRALTVVHLPSIGATLEGLTAPHLDTKSSDYKALIDSFKECLTITKPILAHAQTKQLMALETTTELLHESLPEQAAPTPAFGLKGTLLKGKGFLTATAQSAAATVSQTTDTLKNGGIALTGLATQTLTNSIQNLTSPLTMRVNALKTCLTDTSFLVVVGGGLTALLFPPAIPLVAGLAVLEAPEIYKEAMEAERANRPAPTKTHSFNSVLDAFKNQPPVVQLETAHVLVRIQTRTGESDGIILSGKYTGQDLTSIDPQEIKTLVKFAPDTETKQILQSWAKGH